MNKSELIARTFHEVYERLAPKFGYETRPDTKAFDPETPNGKLMIAVCSDPDLLAALADAPDEGECADALKGTIVSALHEAWIKYANFFGEEPHGTIRQIKAMCEMGGVFKALTTHKAAPSRDESESTGLWKIYRACVAVGMPHIPNIYYDDVCNFIKSLKAAPSESACAAQLARIVELEERLSEYEKRAKSAEDYERSKTSVGHYSGGNYYDV